MNMWDRWWNANEFEVWFSAGLAGAIFLGFGIWYGFKKLGGTWNDQ